LTLSLIPPPLRRHYFPFLPLLLSCTLLDMNRVLSSLTKETLSALLP
jgi:hypothetical protein